MSLRIWQVTEALGPLGLPLQAYPRVPPFDPQTQGVCGIRPSEHVVVDPVSVVGVGSLMVEKR